MVRSIKVRLVRAVAAIGAAFALALLPALSASAATYDSFSGTISSRPGGAYASNTPYHESTITWSTRTKVRVAAELHDSAADGKGPAMVAYVNYYNQYNNFVGQKTLEGTNPKGYGTMEYVALNLASPPSGAVRGTLSVYVCNGKDSQGRNLNCGDPQTFNP